MAMTSHGERYPSHRPNSRDNGLKKIFKNVLSSWSGYQLPHQAIQNRKQEPSAPKVPIPLHAPVVRKRAIIHLRPQRAAVEQKASKFYTVLPREIQTLIFEYALHGDGNVVHIIKRGKRAIHVRCRNQLDGQPCTFANPCSPGLPQRDLVDSANPTLTSAQRTRFYDSLRIKRTDPWGVINLLRTCRQVYCDVIPILYTKTHFHFPHPTDLALFSSKVDHDMLEKIRILSFDVGDFDSGFTIEPEDEVRDIALSVSTGLNSLRELRIYVKKWIEDDVPAVFSGSEGIGGLVLGDGLKEKARLGTFQIIVPGRQYYDWKNMLVGKSGVDLCVYWDDTIPEVEEVVTKPEPEEVHETEGQLA